MKFLSSWACSSSHTLKEHNVLEAGTVSIQWWKGGEATTICLGPLKKKLISIIGQPKSVNYIYCLYAPGVRSC